MRDLRTPRQLLRISSLIQEIKIEIGIDIK